MIACHATLACVFFLLLPFCRAGLPECSPTLYSCPYGFSVPFAELTSDLSAASFALSSAADADVLCSSANWARRDRCESDRCPLRFVAARGDDGQPLLTLCIEDNDFSPYDPAKHVSHTHPLHKQSRGLVVPGTRESATRFGCAASDYAGKDAAGKVAVVLRGACRFDTKFQAAEEAGAVAILILQNRPYNQLTAAEGHISQMVRMVGSSDGFSIPGGIASRQDGDLLLQHYYAGASLRGHYELVCGPVTPDDAATDGCPDDRLFGLCDGQPAEKDRLCSRCPLELWVGCDGGRGGCDGRAPVCLLGNLLRPRVARNYLQLSTARGATWTLAGGGLAYVRGADVAFGCVASDWAGLSGTVVVVRLQTACTPFHAVRLAEAAGVAAYVLLSTHETARAEFVLGQSAFVGIPVHTIAGRDVSAFRDAVDAVASAAVAAPGTAVHADVVLLPTSTLRVPEAPARVAPPVAPDAAAIAAAADAALAVRMGLLGGVSLWSPVLATGIALVVLFGCGVCGWVAWWVREHRAAPHMPLAPVRKRWRTLPLGCAITALGLSLLVATTMVAFGMAHSAGKSSSDTAMQGGRVAAQEVHIGAVANVDGLALEVRLTVVRRAVQALDAVVQRGEQYVEALHAVFATYNGTWEEFRREALRFASMGRAAQAGGWTLEVFTTSRFLMSHPSGAVDGFLMTDDRSDAERADGVSGTVAETQQGWRYGTNYLMYEPISHSAEYWISHTLGEFNTTRKMGNEIGDPIAVVAGRPVGFRQWRVTARTFPHMNYMESYQPLSVFAPLYRPDGAQAATLAAHISLWSLGQVITRGIRDATLANMTLLVFDKETGRVIASNAFVNILNVAAVAKPTYVDLREMYTLHTAPAVQVKALAGYLDSLGAGLWAEASARPAGLHRVMDQAEHWAEQPGDVFAHVVVAADGALRDIGVHGTRVAVVGSSGAVCGAACVVLDADAGRPVLRLDGTQALCLYRNLTTDMPLVSRTASRGADGVVTNTDPRFRESMDAGDGVRCVSHSHEYTKGVWQQKCLLLYDITRDGALTFTFSIRVRSDEVVPGGWGPDAPVLFSEALDGEANVRFFANGYLMMNVLRHGCRAEGLTGGLPAGVWTTLTAQVDGPNNRCRVFVNGRPHGEGRITSVFRTAQGSDPYVVGQRFSGRMDGVWLFTIPLTDAEVWRLHADDVLVREVPHRLWYVELHSYERNTAARAGINWGLAAMLPRADVLRTVNENNARTYAALLKREDDTRQKLERDITEAACFSVAIGLFSVLVFLVFNLYLTGPITQAALSLHRAAFLEIDELPVVHSRITEVHVISEATNTMCKNLREYQSYLPLYIKAAASLESASATAAAEGEAEAEAEAVAAPETTSVEAGPTNPLQHKPDDTDSTGGSDNVSIATSVAASELSVLETPRGKSSTRLWRIGAQQLVKRRVAVAVTNLRQYTRRTHGALELCQDVHGHALEILLPLYRKHGGIPDAFTGDKFVCMYNMASFCDKPAAAAARTALELVGALHCNTAVTTGECRVGPLGNSDMRRFCAIGPVLQWVSVLERIARAMGVPAAADRFVREALPMFALCVRSLVVYKRLGPQLLDVCELVGVDTPSGNAKEWMYELDESGGKKFSYWNDFCLLVAGGRFEEASGIEPERLACAQERCPQVHAMFLEALKKRCPLSMTTSGPSVLTYGGEAINMQSLVESYAIFAACDAVTPEHELPSE